MRLLLLEHDAWLRAQIRRHVGTVWTEAQFVTHDPVAKGPLAAEFLAQGYDAVVLGSAWPGGHGIDWLQDLGLRPGFAPVIYLATAGDAAEPQRARFFGAFAVCTVEDVARPMFAEVLREASLTQQRALARWRQTTVAQHSRYFGTVSIPGYRCIRRLPGGSVSQLFVAESERAGALVVVKVTPSMRDASGIDQSFERFLQEYEIARRLQHPNIVRCHELGVTDDHAYLAMEYFPDGDLRRLLRQGLEPCQALSLAIQIARALQALHRSGALHRDLKPGNVLMRGTGHVALSDFGLARHDSVRFEVTDPGLIFGTPHYMSPEQGHGEPVDARTDLYSLGVILHEMLTGERPFTDSNPMSIVYKHRNAPIPRLPERLQRLQPLLDRLLAKRPEDRPADAQEVERALYDALLQVKGLAA
ncbi:MAG: hypothetical protein RL026_1214 [Pseudomonadota bacterium]